MGRTIKEFCDAYASKIFMNTKNGVDERVEWLKKELEIKTYVPFAEKRELCKMVLDSCCTKDSGGFIKMDSVSRYIIFTMSVIAKYTNLEFSSDENEEYDALDEYDMLCENRLLDIILALLGDEYAACNNLLNMMLDDIITNNNTVTAVFNSALDKVSGSIDNLLSALSEKVEEAEFDLSQIDFDKYKGLLDLLPKK